MHSYYSSYWEALLEHLFVGRSLSHLWLRDGTRVDVLKPQVDDSGYDLVLEARGTLRHVQLKSTQRGSSVARVNVHTALRHKPGGCVVWLEFDVTTLEFSSLLWLGGKLGEKLPPLGSQVSKHSKANAQGVKAPRPNLLVVKRASFQLLTSLAELATTLFGPARTEDAPVGQASLEGRTPERIQ